MNSNNLLKSVFVLIALMSFSIQSMANWTYGDDDWWWYLEHRYDWYVAARCYTYSYGGAGGSSGGSGGSSYSYDDYGNGYHYDGDSYWLDNVDVTWGGDCSSDIDSSDIDSYDYDPYKDTMNGGELPGVDVPWGGNNSYNIWTNLDEEEYRNQYSIGGDVDYDKDGTVGSNNNSNSKDNANKPIPKVSEIAKSLPKYTFDYYKELKEQGKVVIKMVDPANPEKGVKIRPRNAWIDFDVDPPIIYLKYISYFDPDQYTVQLTQELFHMFQDQSGIMSMVNENHSPLEYQETAMQSINTVIRSGCPMGNLLGRESEDFENWIKTVIHDDVVDYDKFIEGIDMCYSSFVAAHIESDPSGYSQDQELVYKDAIANMKWKEVLEWYGYTIK